MATRPSPLTPLPAAEAAVLGRLQELAGPRRDRLIAAVHRESRARRFTYKGYQPMGMAPFVVERSLLPTLEALTRSIYRFQLRASLLHKENAFGFADLMRLEGRTQKWFDRWTLRPARPWELLIRPDYSLRPGPDGELQPVLFELNSLMLGGIYLHSEALEIVEGRVLPSLGLKPPSLGVTPTVHLLSMLKDWVMRSRREAGFARDGGIAMLESTPGGGFSELPRITRFFQREGIRALHGDPRELREKGGRVLLRGMPVSFVYRDFSFEDVPGPKHRRMRPFTRLWDEGRVSPHFPSDFDQKGILECFTSSRFDALFTRREVQRFRRHVPWTRVLTERRTQSPQGRAVDLPGFVLKERERLVLKPSWSSGGDGILIGRKVTAARWDKAIERGLKSPGGWAVQDYVDVPRRPSAFLREGRIHFKPCRFTLGIFFDGDRFGFHARVSPKDIVNVAQGGALSAVFLG